MLPGTEQRLKSNAPDAVGSAGGKDHGELKNRNQFHTGTNPHGTQRNYRLPGGRQD